MYRTISSKNYRNLGEFKIKVGSDYMIIGNNVHIIRSRTSIEDGTTDYSMDTDCTITDIVNGQLVLDNHKPNHNIVYYLMSSDTMISKSKTHIYNQFLVPGDVNPDQYMDKNLYYVMLHASYKVCDLVTHTWHEVPVFADNEDDAIAIIKRTADIHYKFEYMDKHNFVRKVY